MATLLHMVSTPHSHLWSLGSVLSTEVLWQRTLLYGVDTVVVEPRCIARNDDWLTLRYHNVLPRNPLPLIRGHRLILLDSHVGRWSLGGDGRGRRGLHVQQLCWWWRESRLVGGA